MDLSQREGRYPVPPQAGPILGVEFSGVIEKTSPHCTIHPSPPTFSVILFSIPCFVPIVTVIYVLCFVLAGNCGHD